MKKVVGILIALILILPVVIVTTPNVRSEEVGFDYRGPKCDEIYIVVITTQEAQMLSFRRGEIDVLGWPGVPPTQVVDLMKDPNIHLVTTEPNEYYPLVFNCRKYPFNITEFRKAIAHMVNKEEIVKVLLLGYGRPATSCIPKGQGIWFNYNVTDYPFNLTRAAEILDKLGFVDTDGDGVRNDPRTGENLPEFTIMIPSYDPIRMAHH